MYTLFKFILLSFYGLLLLLPSSANAIKLVHYNIQEFDTVKIQTQGDSLTQFTSAKMILTELQPDILSLNEIQYDLPNVPNKNYLSIGKNLQFISRDLLNNTLMNTIFFPANTGNNALRNENNEYVRNPTPNELSQYADPINFGMFPAQYSTGALTHYKVLSVTQINTIKWKDFNPQINLSLYADEHQHPLPENMPLFDKNFTDIVILIKDRPVHLILLHTVPSFAFNNPKSPNFVRNRDQLLFLKWYLGETIDYASHKMPITPLKKETSFIAMGDWNVDINEQGESAEILKDLGKKYHYANNIKTPTYRGMDLLNNDLQLHLDYILLSNDIGVRTGGIFAPTPDFKKIGCHEEKAYKDGYVLVSIKEDGQICRYLVEKNYYYSKTASDHLAIWADIYLR